MRIIYTIQQDVYKRQTGFLPIFSSPFGSSCWNLAFPVLAYCLVSFSKHDENPARKKRMLLILLIGTIASLVIAMLLMNYDLTAKHGKHMELIAQHAVCLLYTSLCSAELMIRRTMIL